ncbi:DUF2125 domain-containing protein [Phenylobacterium montanum]|uniref:DUF2125 domain-containing protein n=1 Tax=Phenylobacterium montanum TaxID=2823693 RepID=A0A975FXE4_9CAUL|nr:DUF2125 domain-containing protein [Caulobacter sp. S6]QUD86916.1 DUF2125 domain-containing protein [Caulobacter sp. S6]
MTSPRKPPSRFWLYAPYGLALVLALGWSLAWVAIRQVAVDRLDQTAARLKAEGWTVAWSSRSVGGYPFRLLVELDQPRIAEPSGWSLAAPQIRAEAYAFDPGRWVMLAPQGLTLTRPLGGPIRIDGQAIKAGFTHLSGQAVPQLALEGQALTLEPQAGGQPLPISRADRLALYVRPLPGDRAEFQLQLKGAAPIPGALLARISDAKPVDLIWDETLSHVSQLGGRDWPSAVRRWSQAGGTVSLEHGQIDAGEARVGAWSGQTSVDQDGHLAGAVTLDFSRAGGASQRLAGGLISLARADLTLEGGKIRLGPFVIGKAPRVY